MNDDNKKKTLNVSVIIPAYNEKEVISSVLKSLLKYDYEIIVIDDGSKDGTPEIIKADFPEVKLLRNPYNIGNGASVRKGIEHATGDVVVCMDADGQHDPDKIAKLLEYIPEYDMVIASRHNNSKVSKFRSFGNKILISLAQFLSGHEIKDLTSGFRAIKKHKIEGFLHLFPMRYSYPTTSVMAFLCNGHTINYVPMDSIKKRDNGTSSIQPFRDGLKFINIMLRIIMLFHPQKIFIPLSFSFFLIGIGLAARSVIYFHKIVQSSAIMVVTSVLIFLFGLLAEQISSLVRKAK